MAGSCAPFPDLLAVTATCCGSFLQPGCSTGIADTRDFTRTMEIRAAVYQWGRPVIRKPVAPTLPRHAGATAHEGRPEVQGDYGWFQSQAWPPGPDRGRARWRPQRRSRIPISSVRPKVRQDGFRDEFRCLPVREVPDAVENFPSVAG